MAGAWHVDAGVPVTASCHAALLPLMFILLKQPTTQTPLRRHHETRLMTAVCSPAGDDGASTMPRGPIPANEVLLQGFYVICGSSKSLTPTHSVHENTVSLRPSRSVLRSKSVTAFIIVELEYLHKPSYPALGVDELGAAPWRSGQSGEISWLML